MSLLTRKTVVLAKVETTYGTDAAPAGASNAMLVSNVTLTPLVNDMAQRNYVRPFLGTLQELVAASRATLDFEVEIAGSGAAGTAPAWGAILRACGFSETLSAGVSAVYAPVSDSFDSVTICTFIDGVKHALLGARGTVDFTFKDKTVPTLKIKMTGLYAQAADLANPAITLTSWQTPLAMNNANTSGFSLHGYAGVLSDLTVTMANNVQHLNLVGAEEVRITDRKPTGTITIEAVHMAQMDYFTRANTAALGALTLAHGTVAGNKVLIDLPNVQVTKPTYADLNGIRMLTMSLIPTPSSAGNDEISITAQ